MTNKNKRTEIARLGEFGLIDRLTEPFEVNHPTTILSIGDDAAHIKHGESGMLISTDLLLEGIHFDLTFHPLQHLGYKAVVVNLSDICAMNGLPTQITFSMAVSNRFSVEALEALYSGVQAACDRYGVDLVGGDTTSSPKGLFLSVTALGKPVNHSAVPRSGAKPGHYICVSGDLGAAYIGLQVLNREKAVYMENPDMQPELKGHEYVVGRQLKPEARADLIRLLQKTGITPSAMIDVSDGLSSDLLHIAHQSNVGVRIHESEVPIHKDTYEMAVSFGMDPITVALSGGEDYELLFTIREEDLEPLMKQKPDVAVIGRVTDAAGQHELVSRSGIVHELTAQGWNPLKSEE